MLVKKWLFILITSALAWVINSLALGLHEENLMRLFKVTACIPSPEKVRTQRELQNTYFTKWVPYDSWFAEQQRIMKQGGKIIKVELASGRLQQNCGN